MREIEHLLGDMGKSLKNNLKIFRQRAKSPGLEAKSVDYRAWMILPKKYYPEDLWLTKKEKETKYNWIRNKNISHFPFVNSQIWINILLTLLTINSENTCAK